MANHIKKQIISYEGIKNFNFRKIYIYSIFYYLSKKSNFWKQYPTNTNRNSTFSRPFSSSFVLRAILVSETIVKKPRTRKLNLKPESKHTRHITHTSKSKQTQLKRVSNELLADHATSRTTRDNTTPGSECNSPPSPPPPYITAACPSVGGPMFSIACRNMLHAASSHSFRHRIGLADHASHLAPCLSNLDISSQQPLVGASCQRMLITASALDDISKRRRFAPPIAPDVTRVRELALSVTVDLYVITLSNEGESSCGWTWVIRN